MPGLERIGGSATEATRRAIGLTADLFKPVARVEALPRPGSTSDSRVGDSALAIANFLWYKPTIDMITIASFNVENLFVRSKAFNSANWSDAERVPGITQRWSSI